MIFKRSRMFIFVSFDFNEKGGNLSGEKIKNVFCDNFFSLSENCFLQYDLLWPPEI